MNHRANADFWADYHALPTAIRERADKQFSLLKANPQHPSLQFKKLDERNGKEIWSVRVTLKIPSLSGQTLSRIRLVLDWRTCDLRQHGSRPLRHAAHCECF